MPRYLHAEILKHRHSFLMKWLLIAPAIAFLSAYILMPFYFTINAYNWWYVILMPATFALIPAMMHQREERKLHYRAIFSLKINLKKIWVSKICVALIYMGICAAIHLLGIFALQSFIGDQMTPPYAFLNLFSASMILVIVNLWQAPFCLFLAKKMGLIVSVTTNTVLGVIFGILLSDSSWWLYCPYSWGIRLMVPILHILPNGVPAERSNPMIANTPILIPCLLSIGLFVLLTIITASYFSELEVKS